MKTKDLPFSARGPLNGFLFQCRFALFESLHRLRYGEIFDISIETYDDISIEKNGSKSLLQVKHVAENITDASPDLWKTLRIWCNAISSELVSPNSKFFLIITTEVTEGSAIFYLKSDDNRDVHEALVHLNNTAKTSKNKKNKKAYEEFQKFPKEQKLHLLENIFVIDSVPRITDLDSEINKEICFAVKPRLLKSYRERLQGWWDGRIIQHINSKEDIISSQEIQDKIDILREQFKEDNLPVDPDIMKYVVNTKDYDNYTFVKQLKWIEDNNALVFPAIKNYYRASEHRSRWLREGFVNPEELEIYEDELIDEWDICFRKMKRKLGKDADEKFKLECANALYNWIEINCLIQIRPAITKHFVARGSYQILANNKKIGWHPDFKEKLESLLTQVNYE